jgi:hypothetical protein
MKVGNPDVTRDDLNAPLGNAGQTGIDPNATVSDRITQRAFL